MITYPNWQRANPLRALEPQRAERSGEGQNGEFGRRMLWWGRTAACNAAGHGRRPELARSEGAGTCRVPAIQGRTLTHVRARGQRLAARPVDWSRRTFHHTDGHVRPGTGERCRRVRKPRNHS
jgi:hypothetical protein